MSDFLTENWHGRVDDPFSFVPVAQRADYEKLATLDPDPQLAPRKIALSHFFAKEYKCSPIQAYSAFDQFSRQFTGEENPDVNALYDRIAPLHAAPTQLPEHRPQAELRPASPEARRALDRAELEKSTPASEFRAAEATMMPEEWLANLYESERIQLRQLVGNLWNRTAEALNMQATADALGGFGFSNENKGAVAGMFAEGRKEQHAEAMKQNQALNREMQQLVKEANRDVESDAMKFLNELSIRMIPSLFNFTVAAWATGGTAAPIMLTGNSAGYEYEAAIREANPGLSEADYYAFRAGAEVLSEATQVALLAAGKLFRPKTKLVPEKDRVKTMIGYENGKPVFFAQQAGKGPVVVGEVNTAVITPQAFNSGGWHVIVGEGGRVVAFKTDVVLTNLTRVVDKSLSAYAKFIGGSAASGAAISAFSKFLKNSLEISLGVRPEDKRFEGVLAEGAQGGVFNAFFAGKDLWQMRKMPGMRQFVRESGRQRWDKLKPADRYEAKSKTREWALLTLDQAENGGIVKPNAAPDGTGGGGMPKFDPYAVAQARIISDAGNGYAAAREMLPRRMLEEMANREKPSTGGADASGRQNTDAIVGQVGPASAEAAARQAAEQTAATGEVAPEQTPENTEVREVPRMQGELASAEATAGRPETTENAPRDIAEIEAAQAEDLQDLHNHVPHDVEKTEAALSVCHERCPGIPVKTYRGWPEEIAEKIRERGQNPDHVPCYYDKATGEASFNVEAFGASRADELFTHEVAMHGGLDRLLGDKAPAFYDAVARDFRNDPDFIRIVEKYFPGADVEDLTPEQLREVGEEYTRHIGMEGMKPEAERSPWYSRFISWLKRVFDKIGFRHLTRRDLQNTALAAARYATRVKAARGGRGSGTRFAIGGEKGAARMRDAQQRLDNLAHAKQLAAENYTRRSRQLIKLAYGWEKDAKTGQWHFELPDVKLKREMTLPDGTKYQRTMEDIVLGTQGKLGEFFDAPELFEAYPELKDVKVVFSELGDPGVKGWYDHENRTITVNTAELERIGMDIEQLESVSIPRLEEAPEVLFSKEEKVRLLQKFRDKIEKLTKEFYAYIDNEVMPHEVQHYIQRVEGFPGGGNIEMAAQLVRNTPLVKTPKYRKLIDDAEHLFEVDDYHLVTEGWNYTDIVKPPDAQKEWIASRDLEAKKLGYKSLGEVWEKIRDMRNAETPYGKYRRFAGEVQSRNVSKRSTMTEDEKSMSLLDDTADVAPEDRIYIYDALGQNAMAEDSGGYFQDWQDVLARFKQELEGVELTPEQQEIYDAVTTPKKIARIRIDDLNELEDVYLHHGTRKKGARKIITVHYAGLRNPVTALEVVRMGDIIRRGTLAEEGNAEYPNSRRYELKTPDGATLKLIIDTDRRNKKTVINLYSDRKPEIGGNNTGLKSDVITADDNINASGEKSSGNGGNGGAEAAQLAADMDAALKQKFGSGNTSLRQVAAGFRKIEFQPGTVNLDLGGGKFDEATKYLAEKGVTNLIFDPVNRDADHNRQIYEAVRNGGVDTVTCNNVLNVIGEAAARDNVILQAAKALKPGGTAYFTVYEGSGTGEGRQSQADAWQENRKTADYLDEVRQHFGDVTLKNKVIIARQPQTEGKLSAWFTDASFENPLRFAIDDGEKNYVDPVPFDPDGRPDLGSVEGRAVAVLKPRYGSAAEFDDAEVAAYLNDHGFEGIDEREAHRLAVLAKNAAHTDRMRESIRKANQRRDDWIYDNVPLYRHAVDFGGKGFKIRFPKDYAHKDDSGTFLAKKGESGIDLIELAKYIARVEGRPSEEKEIAEELAEFFRDLKKPDLYRQYYDAVRETAEGEREVDRQAKEEYARYLEEQARDLIEKGAPVTRETLEENPALAKVLYNHILGKAFPGRKWMTNGDIDDINAALMNKSDNPRLVAAISGALRQDLRKEYTEKMRDFREQLRGEIHDAKHLQQEALKIINEFIPPRYRGRYLGDLIKLTNITNAAKRQLEFDKLCKRIVEEDAPADEAADTAEKAAKKEIYFELPKGERDRYLSRLATIAKLTSPEKRVEAFDALVEEVRQAADAVLKVRSLARLAKRLKELSPKVNKSRRIVGVRSIDSQTAIAEIAAIVRLSPPEADALAAQLHNQIEAAEANGDTSGVADAEAKLVLLKIFGGLTERSGREAHEAFETLQLLAAGGKLDLLREIGHRKAADQAVTDLAVRRMTSGQGLKVGQEAEIAANAARESLLAGVNKYAYGAFKLFDQLYLLSTNGETGDWLENPLGLLAQLIHTTQVAEFTTRREFARRRDAMLDQALGTTGSVMRAAKLQKLRTRETHTGIWRYTTAGRTITYEYVPEETARLKVAEFDRGQGDLLPYQAELLRDRLRAREMRMERTFDPNADEGDPVTKEIFDAMDKETDAETGERLIGIPTVAFVETPVEWQERTQLEALTMKLGWMQRDVRYKMIFNGWTEESIRQLDNFLLPETKKLGDLMLKEYADEYQRLAPIYEAVYYAKLPQIENYAPMSYPRTKVGDTAAPSLDDPNSNMRAPRRIAPGSLSARTAHTMEPVALDALTVFDEHFRRTDHFIHWAKPARPIRGALLVPEIKAVCDQVLGPGFFSTMQQNIIDTVNGGIVDPKSDVVYAVERIFNTAVGLRMAFSFVSGAKQMMSGFAYANDVPLPDFIRCLAYSWAHPAETIGVLLKSDYLKNRFTGGADLFEAMALGGRNRYANMQKLSGKVGRALHLGEVGAATSQILENSKYWGSLAQRLGDSFPVVIFGSAVYRYYYKRALADRLTPEEAHEKALVRWEMSSDSLQQSPAVHNQNAYQKSPFGRILSVFKSANILGGQRALRELVALKTWGNSKYIDDADVSGGDKTYEGATLRSRLRLLGTAVGSLLVTGTLIRLVEAAFREGRKHEDDRKDFDEVLTDAALGAPLDNLSVLPGVEQIVGVIFDYATGNAAPWRRLTSSTLAIDDLEMALRRYRQTDTPEERRKSGKDDAELFYEGMGYALRFLGGVNSGAGTLGAAMLRGKQLYDLFEEKRPKRRGRRPRIAPRL